MDRKEYSRMANEKYKNIRIFAEDWELLRELSAECLVSMTKMLHWVMPIARREFGKRGFKNEEE